MFLKALVHTHTDMKDDKDNKLTTDGLQLNQVQMKPSAKLEGWKLVLKKEKTPQHATLFHWRTENKQNSKLLGAMNEKG